LERKSLAATDKLTSLAEAGKLVRDGDHIAIGGCMFTRTPLGLLIEILRQGRTGLTLSKNLMCYEGEWFMAAGAVEALVTSWLGIGLPWGISRIMRENAEENEYAVRVEEWSHMGLGMRYRAASMGLPFLPTLTMIGSDFEGITETETMTCPFTGEELLLVPALYPEVAVLHVHRADRFGNCQIDGYPFMDYDIATAATTVLVTAEEIISEEEIRRIPDRTAIPGFLVDALVELPYGAYPHEMHGLYEADFEHYDSYVAAIKEEGTEAINAYLDRYVYGTKDHQGYLALFDQERLARQARYARELTGAT
jgi:glutaconate CoA-transferase subunit A